MSVDVEALVLGGILPSFTGRLARARIRLTADHFYSENHKSIYTVLERFYDKYGVVLDPDLFSDLLAKRNQGSGAAKVVVLEQLYQQLAAMPVSESRFMYGLDELISRQSQRATGEAISEAYEILERGWEDPNGKPGEVLEGHSAARQHLYARLSEIDRAEFGEHAPEGDMRSERQYALTDYAARKERDQMGGHIGVISGIGAIDRAIGGMAPGELALVVGYTTAGKSQLCTSWSWHAAVMEGLDVAFFTTETVRDQVKRRLYARHSRHPMFGRPGGINSKDIRNGTLSAADEEVFRAVVDDLENNPKYGAFYLAQVPHGAPLSYVESRLREAGRRRDLKLCVVDYLALIRSDTKRPSAREEANDVLRGAKQMATSFSNGEGIPVISPWQVQQAAYREAMARNAYTLTNLADTSEAEKVSDTIMAIIREEQEDRFARLQFLKVRDGDLPPISEVSIDFRNSYWEDRTTVAIGAAGGVGQPSELSAFLDS